MKMTGRGALLRRSHYSSIILSRMSVGLELVNNSLVALRRLTDWIRHAAVEWTGLIHFRTFVKTYMLKKPRHILPLFWKAV